MHDGPGEEIVELSIVTSLRGGGIDLEQRFGFSAAHGLIGHRRSGCARTKRRPEHQAQGKMNAATQVPTDRSWTCGQ